MRITPENLNNEEMFEEPNDVEMGYTQLFDHFSFTKEERMNPDKVDKVQYIWKGLTIIANQEEKTQMQVLSDIEMFLGDGGELPLLIRIYQHIKLRLQRMDIDAQLNSL